MIMKSLNCSPPVPVSPFLSLTCRLLTTNPVSLSLSLTCWLFTTNPVSLSLSLTCWLFTTNPVSLSLSLTCWLFTTNPVSLSLSLTCWLFTTNPVSLSLSLTCRLFTTNPVSLSLSLTCRLLTTSPVSLSLSLTCWQLTRSPVSLHLSLTHNVNTLVCAILQRSNQPNAPPHITSFIPVLGWPKFAHETRHWAYKLHSQWHSCFRFFCSSGTLDARYIRAIFELQGRPFCLSLLVSFFRCCYERNSIPTASLSHFISRSLGSTPVLFLSSRVRLLNSHKRQHAMYQLHLFSVWVQCFFFFLIFSP